MLQVFQSGETAVERLTLQHVLPNALAVLGNLLTVVELQEPTFKEVIVMYRYSSVSHVHILGCASQACMMANVTDVPALVLLVAAVAALLLSPK